LKLVGQKIIRIEKRRKKLFYSNQGVFLRLIC